VSFNFDAALLKKLSSMTLRARYVAEGTLSGLHKSPLRGSSLEFAQHRQYVPGDELKHLDWKVYGRSDRFYIKQYQEETNLRCYSAVDTSASMGYSSNGVSKLEYASYLAAALTYLLVQQNDSAGLITYRDSIDRFIPPRSFRAHMQYVMDNLEDLRAQGRTDILSVASEIGRRIKKRSLLIIFSDLYENPGELVKAFKYFPYLRNDLIVFHILDPEELHLNQRGDVDYVDMETGEALRTVPEVIRKEYLSQMKAFLEDIEKGLRAHKVDYYRISTDTPLDAALSTFIEGRKRLLL